MKKHRLWLLGCLLVLAVVGTIASRAQDPKALRPPKGAKVAIVIFEDMQCPDCARANPLVEEAARTYKIPLVRYDYPLPQHDWSKEAAIIARYLETKSKKLGDDYRDEVFKHQQEITKQNLRPFSEKFAAEHKVDLPVFPDPQGKLASAIQEDFNFGQRVGITHTPTIYVVSNARQGTPFVEVVDRTQLFQMIDQMKRETD